MLLGLWRIRLSPEINCADPVQTMLDVLRQERAYTMTDQRAPERVWYSGGLYHAKHLRHDPPESDAHPQIEYVRKDLHDATIKQRDELYAEMQAWKLRCVKAEAERDQALAASAAREIAMRDRAAACSYGYLGAAHIREKISALPLSPDGQQALDDMLADAWDAGRQSRLVERNPYRKAET